MNQEPKSGGSKITTESVAAPHSRQGSTRRSCTTKHDVIGVIMGVLVLIGGIWQFAVYARYSELESGGMGAILLLISVGLFIPSRAYEHATVRAIGFFALSLAVAAIVSCAGWFGFCTLGFISNPSGDFAGLAAMIGVVGLLASAVPIFCTWLMLKKLGPTSAQKAAVIAAGIALGLLVVLLQYLLIFNE